MFKKRQAGGPVGLDLDCSFLAAAAVSDGRIARAASTELPPGIVSDGEVADPSALSAALKEFFARAGLPKAVRLGVSNQQIVVRQLELPPIEDERDDSRERQLGLIESERRHERGPESMSAPDVDPEAEPEAGAPEATDEEEA